MKAIKQYIAPGLTVLALGLSVSFAASGSAHAVSPTGMMHLPKPTMASQCDNPGFHHYGFSTKQACLDAVATANHPGNGGGFGYNGNGNHITITNQLGNIFSNIGSIAGSAISVTINFVTNIFH